MELSLLSHGFQDHPLIVFNLKVGRGDNGLKKNQKLADCSTKLTSHCLHKNR